MNNEKINKILTSDSLNGFIYINNSSEVIFSSSVQSFTGYNSEELIARGGLYSIIHEDDRFNVEDFFAEIEEDSTTTNEQIEFRIIKKNNEIIWVKDDIKISRNELGDMTEITGIVTSINKLKEYEFKLINLYEQMEEQNMGKDKFISIISHDLRAPFTSIIGFSEILLTESELPEKDKNEYLQYIFDASTNQLQLIDYLLDWSRLQTGRMHLELQNINLKHLISSCVADLTGMAITKKIEIEVDINQNFEINGDNRLLSQVFTNLINNAIKFSSCGKRIYITANQFKEGYLEIIVKDEGIGIPHENQIKLFKIEDKVSTDGTEGEKGTGLGLMLVKEIIEKHKGNVWFYSEPNKGTEFHITLQESQNIVLIVEDDEQTKKMFKKVISKFLENYEVYEASNGYDAMSFIMKKMPSIVITDHDMPLMNGLHLVQALRKRDPKNKIPIIIISAKLTEPIVKAYKNLGVKMLMEKPAETDMIINAIKRALSI